MNEPCGSNDRSTKDKRKSKSRHVMFNIRMVHRSSREHPVYCLVPSIPERDIP